MSDHNSWPDPGDQPPPPSYPPPPPPGYPPLPGYPPPPGGAYPGYQGYPTPGGWGGPSGAPMSPSGRPVADWWRRLVAIIIDSLILIVVASILGSIFFGATRVTTTTSGGFSIDRSNLTGRWLLDFGIGLMYYGYLNGVIGQTIGKMALRIRVVDRTSGQAIGFGRGVVRYFVYSVLFALCLLPGIINCLSPLWDRMRQAWHDKAVGSLVVSDI